MRLVSYLLIIVSVLGCNSYKCLHGTKENTKEFLRKLDNIKNAGIKGNSVNADEFRESISYLEIVTGIQTKAGISSTFGYRSKEDYEDDLINWNNWLNNNKCKLTDKYIDSIFNRYNIKRF